MIAETQFEWFVEYVTSETIVVFEIISLLCVLALGFWRGPGGARSRSVVLRWLRWVLVSGIGAGAFLIVFGLAYFVYGLECGKDNQCEGRFTVVLFGILGLAFGLLIGWRALTIVRTARYADT